MTKAQKLRAIADAAERIDSGDTAYPLVALYREDKNFIPRALPYSFADIFSVDRLSIREALLALAFFYTLVEAGDA